MSGVPHDNAGLPMNIPQDVIDAAMRAANAQKSDLNNQISMVCIYVAARAILAERARCASVALHLNGWGSTPSPELAEHIAETILKPGF